MSTKVVIFDVDGILFNTDEVYFAELRRALADIDVHIDESFYAQHGYNDCIHALDLEEEQREATLEKVHKRYYTDAILEQVQIKPGVLLTLEALSPTVELAIGSGETEQQILRYLRHFGIDDYFSFIGHSTLVKGRKSNPVYFHTIARHYDVLPQECLHIGDTLTDQYALEAGVPVVIIPTKYSAHVSFDPRCLVLESIEKLPSLLGSDISVSVT